MDKTRLLFVHQANGLGGAAKSLSLLLDSLDRTRFDISVFLPGDDAPTAAFFETRGWPTTQGKGLVFFGSANGVTPVFSFWKPWSVVRFWKLFFQSVRAFEKVLDQVRPELVYLNTIVLTPYGWAAKSKNIPVVWHIREELKTGGLGLGAAFTRYMIRNCATRILCISQTNARRLGVPSAAVVYNYLPAEQIENALHADDRRSAWGAQQEDLLVAMVGGTIRSKGLPLLLRALQTALQEEPRLRLVVAGRPMNNAPTGFSSGIKRLLRPANDDSPVCRRILAADSRLRERVVFAGWMPDVEVLIAQSDWLVWPGSVSHFARPIMEAFSLGKAVIATDWESSREIIEEGVTGLLSPPGDAATLAGHLLHLARDPQRRKQLGDAGKAFAGQHFNAEKNSRAITRIIAETLEGKCLK